MDKEELNKVDTTEPEENVVYKSILADVAMGLKQEEDIGYHQSVDRGLMLEGLLISICDKLGKIADLTEGKGDIELLVATVGSYVITERNGKLAEGARLPRELFNEGLFPMIDNSDSWKEVIEDGEHTTTSN